MEEESFSEDMEDEREPVSMEEIEIIQDGINQVDQSKFKIVALVRF